MSKQLPSYISRDFARRPPRGGGGEVPGALAYKPPSTTMAPLEQDRVGQKSRNPPNEPECGCWSFGKFKQNLGLGVVVQFLIAEMHFPAIFRKLWALLNLKEGPLKMLILPGLPTFVDCPCSPMLTFVTSSCLPISPLLGAAIC